MGKYDFGDLGDLSTIFESMDFRGKCPKCGEAGLDSVREERLPDSKGKMRRFMTSQCPKCGSLCGSFYSFWNGFDKWKVLEGV